MALTSGKGIGSDQATRLTVPGLPLSRVWLSLGINANLPTSFAIAPATLA